MGARTVEEQLSAPEVAQRLGVDESTVWRWVALYRKTSGREGLGPARKLGHKITRFAASAVNRFLESREV